MILCCLLVVFYKSAGDIAVAFSDILGYNESMVQGVLVKGALVSADKECQRPMMKVAVCSNDLAALEQVRMMTGVLPAPTPNAGLPEE